MTGGALDTLTRLCYRKRAMTDKLDAHLRRMRRLNQPPAYSLADKPIYDWLRANGDMPPINRLAVSIYDIVEAMPAEVRDAATPKRLFNYIIPTFLHRIGFTRYSQIVRLLDGTRLRLWIRPNTIDISHGYNVADAYERASDKDTAPHRMRQTEPEHDVWDI